MGLIGYSAFHINDGKWYNDDDGKWDDSSKSWVSTPVSANSKTMDIHYMDNIDAWDLRNGPTLPKVNITNAIASAKGNLVARRLKHSLDKVSLDDDTQYHAVVILPDPENFSKNQQRIAHRYNKSDGDKYAVIRNGDTRFMDQAKIRAGELRKERAAISYNLHTMTFRDVYNILGGTNGYVIIDGIAYEKSYYDKITGSGYKFLVTSGGVIHICRLKDSTQEYQTLVYDVNVRRFIIE